MKLTAVILHTGVLPDEEEQAKRESLLATHYVRFVRIRPGHPVEREACDVAYSKHASLLSPYPVSEVIGEEQGPDAILQHLPEGYSGKRSGVWFRVYDNHGREVTPRPMKRSDLEVFIKELHERVD